MLKVIIYLLLGYASGVLVAEGHYTLLGIYDTTLFRVFVGGVTMLVAMLIKDWPTKARKEA